MRSRRLEVTDMVESRWFRRAGPGIVAMGAILVIASTTAGARPGSWSPPPCAGPPRAGEAPIGAWYRVDPTIVDGVRSGQRLTIGAPGTVAVRGLDLDPESFASGPFGGSVLVGTDDGATSRMSLIDVAAGCAWSVGLSDAVVRRATMTPDGAALIEFRVDRTSRADLGVWRRPLDGHGNVERILPPIEPDERFGPTWLTELSWSDDGSLLAVQSCGEVACRMRWLDLATRVAGSVSDPSLGDLVGLTRDRLVARGACRGLPCPVRSVVLEDQAVSTIVPSGGLAVLARDGAGHQVVVFERDADGGTVASIRLDGRAERAMPADPDGRRLVGNPAWAGSAAELPAGWIAYGPEGRLPIGGPVGALLRRVSDGRTVHFGEVLP
jgi:hypothetical protein